MRQPRLPGALAIALGCCSYLTGQSQILIEGGKVLAPNGERFLDERAAAKRS